MMPKRTKSHKESVMAQLCDDDYAIAYLTRGHRGGLCPGDFAGLAADCGDEGAGDDEAGEGGGGESAGKPEFLTLFSLFKVLEMGLQVKKLGQSA